MSAADSPEAGHYIRWDKNAENEQMTGGGCRARWNKGGMKV